MIDFTANDLLHKYDWHDSGAYGNHYQGANDRVMVNKNNGNEVLYFCTRFFDIFNTAYIIQTFNKVENILKSNEAAHLLYRDDLYDFIVENWTKSKFKATYYDHLTRHKIAA